MTNRTMDSLLLSDATQNLDHLINTITENHQPVIIKGTQNDAIVIAKEDWLAIQETLYLNSIPGYIDSIQETLHSPKEEWVNAKELGL